MMDMGQGKDASAFTLFRGCLIEQIDIHLLEEKKVGRFRKRLSDWLIFFAARIGGYVIQPEVTVHYGEMEQLSEEEADKIKLQIGLKSEGTKGDQE